MDPAAHATLAADIAQLRDAVRVLAEGQQDAVGALADLDKHQAVSEAKADLRAQELAEVRRLVDKIAADVTPAAVYFAAQNASRATAEANKANVWSYVTRERVLLVISIVAGLLSWFRPDLSLQVSSPQSAQPPASSDTVAP